MEIMYRAAATAQEGREGHVMSEDGIIDMNLRPPGKDGDGPATNPEQLFAAGYSACFCGALNLAALRKHLRIEGIKVTVSVGIGKTEEEGFMLDVEITAHVPGVDMETALGLVEDAEGICPYSKATRGNVTTVVKTLND
ncbi:MAG: Ohr family peroxiredoxin [Alistipes sp.]|nr:Ohr family peroxiredoxin [Alistipes sp.]